LFKHIADGAKELPTGDSRVSTDTFFNDAARIDQCIAHNPPAEGLEQIRHLLEDRDLRAYFFKSLRKPSWLGVLRDSGFFNNPPVEGLWPAAGYLFQMANESTVVEQVCDIILDLPETQNRLVRGELVEAIREMPPDPAAHLIDRLEAWAHDTTGLFASDLGVLIAKLAAGGQKNAAMRLAKVLLEIIPPAQGGEGAHGILHPMTRMRSDWWENEQILNKAIPELVKAAGIEALDLLCSQLSTAIRFSLREPEESAPSDLSHIWRPAIEEHGQNLFPEVRSLLVRTVRDAALSIVRSGQASLSETVRTLEERQPRWRIFQRIGMHLLLQIDDAATPQLVADCLTNRDLFDSPECLHEYVRLLQRRFPSLSPDQKSKILSWIDSGPLPDQIENLRRNVPQFTGKEFTEADLTKFVKQWRRDWLQRFGDSLPVEKTAERDALVRELGAAEHPDLSSYHQEVVGLRSPTTAGNLKEKPVSELVKYLKEWQSKGEFMGPSREGLGDILSAIVSENPAPYAKHARLFQEVDATYQRYLLHGFRDALGKKREYDWKPVLDLCRWILDQPIEIQGRKRTGVLDDPDRNWSRSAIASLLETALWPKPEPVPIPFALKHQLWELLEILCRDPQPTLEHEKKYGGSNSDPSHVAINSTRGQAMYAVIFYALWVRKQRAQLDEPKSEPKAVAGFNIMPEVRQVLDERLDLRQEPSLAIRSVYGRFFDTLWQIDRAWAIDRSKTIFPAAEEERGLWEAAWGSYLAFGTLHRQIFYVLKEQYALAVERVGEEQVLPRLPVDPRARLAEHLMALYWNGMLSPDEESGLFEHFWKNAPPKVRSHALWQIGRWLHDQKEDLDAATAERLQRLWERRLSIAQASEDRGLYRDEIAKFGWWFCSRKFAEDWAIQQLQSALEIAGHAEPEHEVYEQLAAAAPQRPNESVRCLERMVLNTLDTNDLWRISAYEKNIRTVLRAAVDSARDAAAIARNLANALGRRGLLQFRDFAKGG